MVEDTRQVPSHVFSFNGNSSLVVDKMDDGLILYSLIIYGVIQILLLTAGIAWFVKMRHEIGILHVKIWDLNNEIVNHAVALSEANMNPLPWEEIEEDFRNSEPDTDTRRNGNVYYLVDDD